MKRETDGKIKKAGAKNQQWPIKATLLLTVLLTFEVLWFTSAYRHLSQSIQKERIDSIEQMSTLISEKLLLLRQNYEDKVRQAGHIIMDSHIRSFEQGRALLLAYDQLYLLAEDGTCRELVRFGYNDFKMRLGHRA